jgi:prevent-host-death family protein
MAREISQRELRNESGEIMRALDRGEMFVVTRNGVPVGELTPLRKRLFVSADGGPLELPLYTRNPSDFHELEGLLEIIPVHAP